MSEHLYAKRVLNGNNVMPNGNTDNGIKRIKSEHNTIDVNHSNATQTGPESRSPNHRSDDEFSESGDELINRVTQKMEKEGKLDCVTMSSDNSGDNAVQPMDRDDGTLSDVPMISDNSSGDNDAIMGRIKILEASKQRAEEQLKDYKIRYLQLEKSKQQLEQTFTQRIKDQEAHTKSLDSFRTNDIKQYERTIAELEDKLKKVMGTDARNAPQMAFGNDILMQRKHVPGFRQQKTKDFYSPIVPQNANASQTNQTFHMLVQQTQHSLDRQSANVLVPQTQTSKSSSSQAFDAFKSPPLPKGIVQRQEVAKTPSCSPIEIPQTPFTQNHAFMNDLVVVPQTQQSIEDMITDSGDDNALQAMSQLNQTQAHNKINEQLIADWDSMKQLINNFSIDDQLDTEWIRNTNQTLLWCKSFVEINASVANQFFE